MQPAIDFNEIIKGLPEFQFLLISQGTGGILILAVQYIFLFAGVALFFYLIAGGFQWMTSRGDPAALKEAQAKITHAIVGFLIIFTAYWIVQLVGTIFGIEEIEYFFSK